MHIDAAEMIPTPLSAVVGLRSRFQLSFMGAAGGAGIPALGMKLAIFRTEEVNRGLGSEKCSARLLQIAFLNLFRGEFKVLVREGGAIAEVDIHAAAHRK